MSYATKEQLESLAEYMASQINVPTIGIGGGYAPIGTINFFDATTAPQDWLACDGMVYNIADYPQLADWYEAQHGSKNFYGGDGTTTFAVPDLQGEFLRGTGTNSHTDQGSGANVGVHQDGTIIENINVDSGSNILYVPTPIPYGNKNIDSNPSTWNNVSKAGRLKINSAGSDTYTAGSGGSLMTSRPTNTSFLICVKAVVAGDVYSTEERVVGTWIDGKKIYQKTILNIEAKSPTNGIVTETKYDISDLSIDTLVGIKTKFHQEVSGSVADLFDFSAAPTLINNNPRCTMVVYYGLNSSTNAGKLVISNSMGYTRYVTVTLQYTKTTD